MARPESRASGGYFPTPPALIPSIAALLDVPPHESDDDGASEERTLAVVDPCAADGAALFALMRALRSGAPQLTVKGYAAELEATRAAALRAAAGFDVEVVHGNALRLRFAAAGDFQGASLLFLNPPYDEGHLEARFVAHFANTLATGGVLLLIVPVGSLTHCAETLARSFEDLAGFRFPEPEYAAFKQVVLLGRRREPLLHPDPALVTQLDGWGREPETVPVLPVAGPAVFTMPVFPYDEAGFSEWAQAPLDVAALARSAHPWRRTDRRGNRQPFPGVLPRAGFGTRSFPVAMPLGEGHVPAALGCGVMNGARLSPDDPASGLPDVYAKAVFRKRWKTAEERKDARGKVVGVVQVQQPELRMTVLDVAASTFHTPRSSAERTDATRLADMTAADILVRYQRAFREVLATRCPALHDPKDPSHALVLPDLPRRLFTAQGEVTRAVVRLLETERAALVLGEVGVGKSTVALAAAAKIAARRIVIVCPPHLLDSWKDQAKAVLPAARTMVLADVGDIDAFATAPDEGIVIGILAQTAGKLRHAWAGLGDPEATPVQLATGSETPEVRAHRATFLAGSFARRCPRCGEVPELSPEELAKTKARCQAVPLVVRGALGRLALSLGLLLLPVFADAASLAELFPETRRARFVERAASALTRPAVRAERFARILAEGGLTAFARTLVTLVTDPAKHGLATDAIRAAEDALLKLFAAARDEGATIEAARTLYASSLADRAWHGTSAERRTLARKLLLLLPPGSEMQADLAREFQAHGANDERYGTNGWDGWNAKVQSLANGRDTFNRAVTDYSGFEVKDGVLRLGKYPVGDARLAKLALDKLKAHGGISEGKPCGEPLYAAVPHPRRVPLVKYLVRRYPGVVELAVIDEAHECTNQDSAQAQAMAKFMGTRMLLLTGSLSNGYAVGLFAILWTISRRFRDEFARDAMNDFGRTYGYERRYIEFEDKDSGEVTGFGANSDRIERRRSKGWAPGVLPSSILKHLLPVSVVLHMEDLKVDLPPRTETVELIEPGEELGRRVRRLRATLVAAIKADRFTDLAGKLFGAMAEEWSSADRASEGIGNSPDGTYRVTYPESVGGALVAALEPFPHDVILPKEKRLIEIVKSELALGRNVLIFAWHAHCGLYERLAGLVGDAIGETVPILDSERVPAREREGWIKRNIHGPKRRVMIVNPAAVGTGLNVLTHFSTIIWFQPPGCAPKALRQAEGRVHRIGQKKPTRVFWLLYKGTSQEILHRLLLLKVAESVALDGLDPTSALEASGVGVQEGMSGFDVGRAIFEAVKDERYIEPAPAIEAPEIIVRTEPVAASPDELPAAPIAAPPPVPAVAPVPPVASAAPVIEARPPTPAPAMRPAPPPAPVLRPVTPVLPPHVIEKTVGPARKSVQLTWSF